MLPYLTALFFYFDSETISGVGGLCFWGRRLKRSSTFLRKKKCIRWPGLRILWPQNSLAPLLRWRLHLMTCLTTLVTWKWPGCLDVLARWLTTLSIRCIFKYKDSAHKFKVMTQNFTTIVSDSGHSLGGVIADVWRRARVAAVSRASVAEQNGRNVAGCRHRQRNSVL